MRSGPGRAIVAAVAIGGPLLLALLAPLLEAPVVCGFRRLFGIPCPGCGMTRSLVALVHLDFGGAFSAQPVGPIFLAYLGAIWVTAWLSWARRADLGSPLARWLPEWFHLGMIGLVIAVWIARFFGLFGGPVDPVDLEGSLLVGRFL